MSDTSSLTSAVAQRYAGSLFDLANESNSVDSVEKELSSCLSLIDESDDLKRLIYSPVFSAKEQLNAVSALCEKSGLIGKKGGHIVANFLRVVAANRRLFSLKSMIQAFQKLAAQNRGEVEAEVISAYALTSTQEKELKATLKNVAGKDVLLHVVVDPKILGGLIVRLGSRQIDASLQTKLSSLKLALKEVG